MNEFTLIDQFFKQRTLSRSDVMLGIEDDAALLKVPDGQWLVVAVDTLVAGVHFLSQTNAEDIGYKALAVNLSDIAAMGAEPAWMTLALTMPSANTLWLDAFSRGLFQLAKEFNVQLVGGDTTRGPLTITIQLQGFVPPHQALCRHSAKVGDKIYVSGTLGDAGFALQVALGHYQVADEEAKTFLYQRLHRPRPQLKLGYLLRHYANAAIDISDGLLADLNHILASSKVGALIDTEKLPLSAALKNYLTAITAKEFALTAGDDYELCFTVSPANEKKMLDDLKKEKIHCSCIGEIIEKTGLHFLDDRQQSVDKGYQHFK